MDPPVQRTKSVQSLRSQTRSVCYGSTFPLLHLASAPLVAVACWAHPDSGAARLSRFLQEILGKECSGETYPATAHHGISAPTPLSNRKTKETGRMRTYMLQLALRDVIINSHKLRPLFCLSHLLRTRRMEEERKRLAEKRCKEEACKIQSCLQGK